MALYDHLKEKMNISILTNKGFKEVPIMWVSAERAFLTKNDQDTRDKKGAMNLPLISIERVSIEKDLNKKGIVYGNALPVDDFKGVSITIARRIKQDKTSEFAAVDAKRAVGQYNFPRKNKKVVYETISIPIPVYVEVLYKIHLKTQYQQQMNDMMQPFITFTGGINYFRINREGHYYEAFINSDYANNSNVSNMDEQERKFESEVSIRVLGYLIGKGPNQEQPKIVIRENAVDIKIARERIVVGDIPEHTDKQSYVGTTGLEGIKK